MVDIVRSMLANYDRGYRATSSRSPAAIAMEANRNYLKLQKEVDEQAAGALATESATFPNALTYDMSENRISLDSEIFNRLLRDDSDYQKLIANAINFGGVPEKFKEATDVDENNRPVGTIKNMRLFSIEPIPAIDPKTGNPLKTEENGVNKPVYKTNEAGEELFSVTFNYTHENKKRLGPLTIGRSNSEKDMVAELSSSELKRYAERGYTYGISKGMLKNPNIRLAMFSGQVDNINGNLLGPLVTSLSSLYGQGKTIEKHNRIIDQRSSDPRTASSALVDAVEAEDKNPIDNDISLNPEEQAEVENISKNLVTESGTDLVNIEVDGKTYSIDYRNANLAPMQINHIENNPETWKDSPKLMANLVKNRLTKFAQDKIAKGEDPSGAAPIEEVAKKLVSKRREVVYDSAKGTWTYEKQTEEISKNDINDAETVLNSGRAVKVLEDEGVNAKEQAAFLREKNIRSVDDMLTKLTSKERFIPAMMLAASVEDPKQSITLFRQLTEDVVFGPGGLEGAKFRADPTGGRRGRPGAPPKFQAVVGRKIPDLSQIFSTIDYGLYDGNRLRDRDDDEFQTGFNAARDFLEETERVFQTGSEDFESDHIHKQYKKEYYPTILKLLLMQELRSGFGEYGSLGFLDGLKDWLPQIVGGAPGNRRVMGQGLLRKATLIFKDGKPDHIAFFQGTRKEATEINWNATKILDPNTTARLERELIIKSIIENRNRAARAKPDSNDRKAFEAKEQEYTNYLMAWDARNADPNSVINIGRRMLDRPTNED